MSANDRRGIVNVEMFGPQIEVMFHTVRGILEVSASKKGIPNGAEDSLVACQTWKDISQPHGSFTIHLTDFARYDRMVFPMDLVTIKMSDHTNYTSRTVNPQNSRDQITHSTMTGLVDSVRRKILIDPNTGKPNVFCEIKGRDFGKLFVKHQIRYIPWLQDELNMSAGGGTTVANPVVAMFKALLSGFTSGGPIDFLQAYNVKKMFSESINLKFRFGSRDLLLQNSMSFRAASKIGIIPYNLPVQAQEGTLWDILKNYANLPFNEMWVDTINNPELVIPPYNPNDISGRSASIISTPLTAAELARNKANTASYIAAQTGTDQTLSEQVFGPGGSKISVGEKYISPEDRANAYTILFLRRTPFDMNDWNSLIRFEITDADIVEQDIGVSDNETYNMFWVYPLLAMPGDVFLKGLGVRPLMFTESVQWRTTPDPDKPNDYPKVIIVQGTSPEAKKAAAIAQANAVEKFGFNPIEIKTRAWRWAEGANIKDAVSAANLLTLAMANWHKHNSILKQGSMTIKGIPDLHVGNKIFNIDENTEFYVEAIAHNYVQYKAMTSTIMVSRGQTPGAIDWGNAYTKYCTDSPLAPGDQQDGIN